MRIERSNGILNPDNKIWTGQCDGMVGFNQTKVLIQILKDETGKATFALGDPNFSIVVGMEYVEELINTYKRDKDNDKTK